MIKKSLLDLYIYIYILPLLGTVASHNKICMCACWTVLHFPFPCSFQYLMEGSYNKVFLAKGNIPAESYTFFIDILLDTIR